MPQEALDTVILTDTLFRIVAYIFLSSERWAVSLRNPRPNLTAFSRCSTKDLTLRSVNRTNGTLLGGCSFLFLTVGYASYQADLK